MIPGSCRSDLPSPGSPLASFCGHGIPATPDRVPHPAPEPIIGVVVSQPHKGKQAETILDAQGVWHSPDLPVLDRVLDLLHETGRHPRGDRPNGHVELVRVADWLKGKVRIMRP